MRGIICRQASVCEWKQIENVMLTMATAEMRLMETYLRKKKSFFCAHSKHILSFKFNEQKLGLLCLVSWMECGIELLCSE